MLFTFPDVEPWQVLPSIKDNATGCSFFFFFYSSKSSESTVKHVCSGSIRGMLLLCLHYFHRSCSKAQCHVSVCIYVITASCSQVVLYIVWLRIKAISKAVTQREAGAASMLHVCLPFSSNMMKGETFSIWQIVMRCFKRSLN